MAATVSPLSPSVALPKSAPATEASRGPGPAHGAGAPVPCRVRHTGPFADRWIPEAVASGRDTLTRPLHHGRGVTSGQALAPRACCCPRMPWARCFARASGSWITGARPHWQPFVFPDSPAATGNRNTRWGWSPSRRPHHHHRAPRSGDRPGPELPLAPPRAARVWASGSPGLTSPLSRAFAVTTRLSTRPTVLLRR